MLISIGIPLLFGISMVFYIASAKKRFSRGIHEFIGFMAGVTSALFGVYLFIAMIALSSSRATHAHVDGLSYSNNTKTLISIIVKSSTEKDIAIEKVSPTVQKAYEDIAFINSEIMWYKQNHDHLLLGAFVADWNPPS